MFGADGKLDRPILHDRNAPLINQFGKTAKCLGRAGAALGNDHRVLGIGKNVYCLLDTGLRRGNRNRLHAKRPVNLVPRAGFTQNLTRQTDIGRALGHR